LKTLIGKQVYFTPDPRDFSIQEGWVLAENKLKFPTHPYIVTKEADKKEVVVDFASWESFFEANRDHIHFVSNQYIGLKTKRLKSRLEILVKAFESSTVVQQQLNYEHELRLVFEGKKPYLKYRATVSRISDVAATVIDFSWSVVILGLLWIVFGNFINLFSSRYRKFQLRKKIVLIEREIAFETIKNHFLVNKKPVSTEKLEKIRQEIEEHDKSLYSASHNIITMTIALTGLIISVLALIKK
jgi:hypothetical protein